ncbi:MAG TPA: 30S ribosomal protein S16, partial [Paludibacter sp.]|nr:30S ribosomal protein S16 [Paludibacter sp.]
LEGVQKGAFDVVEADKRFDAWKASKESSVSKTKEQLAADKQAAAKTRLAAEAEANKAKAAEVAKKKADAIAATIEAVIEEAQAEEAPATEEAAE